MLSVLFIILKRTMNPWICKVPPMYTGSTCPVIEFKKPTLDWLSKKLKEIDQEIKQNNKNEKIILLAHHLMIEDKVPPDIPNAFSYEELSKIDKIIASYRDKILFQFAGHIHDSNITGGEMGDANKFNEIYDLHPIKIGIPIYSTEALLVNIYEWGRDRPIVRIVEVDKNLNLHQSVEHVPFKPENCGRQKGINQKK